MADALFGNRKPILSPTKPESAYKSPLQRLGEALRTPRPATTSHGVALDSTMFRVTRKEEKSFSVKSSRSKLQVHLKDKGPSCDIPNYSYQFQPVDPGSQSSLPFVRDTSNGPEALAEGRQENGGCTDLGFRDDQPSSTCRTQIGSISLLSGSSSNPRNRPSFKPQRSSRGTSSWQLKQYAEATLGSGSLRKAVKLPEGEDKDEWLAVNGMSPWHV